MRRAGVGPAPAIGQPSGLVKRLPNRILPATLATLGYGDVAPAHRARRPIVVAVAVTGLLCMTILVAPLVSLMTTQHVIRSK